MASRHRRSAPTISPELRSRKSRSRHHESVETLGVGGWRVVLLLRGGCAATRDRPLRVHLRERAVQVLPRFDNRADDRRVRGGVVWRHGGEESRRRHLVFHVPARRRLDRADRGHQWRAGKRQAGALLESRIVSTEGRSAAALLVAAGILQARRVPPETPRGHRADC